MEHARTDLTWIGLVGITDPPTEDIPEVVRMLRRAGIRIFMVRFQLNICSQMLILAKRHRRLHAHSSSHYDWMRYHHEPV